MTITEPVAFAQPRHPLDGTPHQVSVEISQEELIRRIRQMRTEAHRAGRRVPGRPALAKMTGATPYRVRQALEEIARDQPRLHQHDRRSASGAPALRNGSRAGGLAGPAIPISPVTPATTAEPQEPASPPTNRRSTDTPRRRSEERAPIGARTSPVSRPSKPQRDLAGSVARAAVLISMFALAAAVWVKAAELSGHQIELAVLPVVDWPVRLAYFAPILVEGAVYAAIRTCHTLEYARDATRSYARLTAAIGLVAMVLVGATVGLGIADEPYVRDGIGGLIGGLGPFMGWRTSRASAMVAGDRRAAAADGAFIARTAPARSNRFAGLLDTFAMAATARVTSWGRTSDSDASATPHTGANLSADLAPGQDENRDSRIRTPASDAGAQPSAEEPADAPG